MEWNKLLETIQEKSSIDNIGEQQRQIKELNLSKDLTNLIGNYCALCNQEIIFHNDKTKEKEICLRWIKDII